MPKYEFTDQQVQNLKALIMDTNIKGAAASTIVGLLGCLENPVDKVQNNDLHGKHHNNERLHQNGTEKD